MARLEGARRKTRTELELDAVHYSFLSPTLTVGLTRMRADVCTVPDARRDRARPEHADGRGVDDT